LSVKSSDGLKRLLGESGIRLGSESADRLLGYLALLERWNSRISLTAAKEWPALEPLFHEGLWASRNYPPESTFHLDVGSGAGFPAILLKILVPRIRLEMVESRMKKSAFLATVIDVLGIGGACVHTERLDAFLGRSGARRIWDCISWKGLKLRTRDLLQLRMHAHPRTQFWIFHGRELAVEEPEEMRLNFQILRSEKLPGRKECSLSTYTVGGG
jgi:16S rRNA G527 N7-methylase RsmG